MSVTFRWYTHSVLVILKSHKNDCLTMSWTKTTIDILMWIGESPGDFNPTLRITGNWKFWDQET